MMKKLYIYIIMCSVALAFSGCQSEDFMAQKSDEYGLIQFSVLAQKAESRAAAEGYESYTDANRPTTMGVWGYADMVHVSRIPALTEPSANDKARTIFTNQEVEYAGSAWSYDIDAVAEGNQGKSWADYSSLYPFDFFAYMPYSAGATLVKTANSQKYTLTVPVSIAANTTVTTTEQSVITDNETALICNKPHHTSVIGDKVPFNMDQALTGFNIQFQLGNKMENVRDVTITSVKIKGNKDIFATSGKISRLYEFNDGWTAGDITWSELVKPSADVDCALTYADNGGTENHDNNYHNATTEPVSPAYLKVGADKMRQWGNTFYVIPKTGFTPTIEVTYDVTLNDNGVTTRKSVTSSIILNKTNFSTYDPKVAGKMGTKYSIRIKIVPSYLYVLADDDQQSGFIVIQ